MSAGLSLDKLSGAADRCTQADVNGRKASLFTAGCFSDFSESWVLMRLRATVCVFVSLGHMTVTRRLLIIVTAGWPGAQTLVENMLKRSSSTKWRLRGKKTNRCSHLVGLHQNSCVGNTVDVKNKEPMFGTYMQMTNKQTLEILSGLERPNNRALVQVLKSLKVWNFETLLLRP